MDVLFTAKKGSGSIGHAALNKKTGIASNKKEVAAMNKKTGIGSNKKEVAALNMKTG